MSPLSLRPPLLPPLSHDNIPFILDTKVTKELHVPDHILVAIASGLEAILPPGDLRVDQNGVIVAVNSDTSTSSTTSMWYQVGLLEGIERSVL